MTLLKQMAHARSGDKTGSLMIGVIVEESTDFKRVGDALRSERLLPTLGLPDEQPVQVYPLIQLNAYNLVFPDALHGAATYTTDYDIFGHAFGGRILSLEVDDV
jgi:hypothetical protein